MPLLASRYNGIDLPVYGADTPVLSNKSQLRALGSQRVIEDTAVRAVEFELRYLDDPPKTIGEVLEKTDEELDYVAKLCGAFVVGHKWGIYHDRDRIYDAYRPYSHAADLLPEEHILVAEVDVIRNVTPIDMEEYGSDIYTKADEGLSAYEQQARQYHLWDMDTYQLVRGTCPAISDMVTRTWLVDIEPCHASSS